MSDKLHCIIGHEKCGVFNAISGIWQLLLLQTCCFFLLPVLTKVLEDFLTIYPTCYHAPFDIGKSNHNNACNQNILHRVGYRFSPLFSHNTVPLLKAELFQDPREPIANTGIASFCPTLKGFVFRTGPSFFPVRFSLDIAILCH